MRRFEDDEGGSWEVVVGRESWGAFFAIFVPRGGSDGRRIRQAMLDAGDGTEAGRTLEEMSEDALRDLLGEAEPKELG